MKRLAALAVLIVTIGGCAAGAADPVASSGLVDIGGDRALFLDCQGAGGPTVFVIPGKGSYAEAWNYVVPPDDPIRSSPYDLITEAGLEPSSEAVAPTVAKTTQVCAYDRPDTRPDGVDLSTPAPQPHTVQRDVDDVIALIDAARLPGPFVFVAHSYGGLILDLLARTHPGLVAGIVMVDPLSEYLTALGSPAQNAAFERDTRIPPQPGAEAVVISESIAQIHAAPPLPRVPAVVLSSDKFQPPEALSPDNYTLAQIHAANAELAAALGAAHIVSSGSGHNMMLYQPKFVADNIIDIVERVRGRP
ncbi:alpha/beta fold hydrolase [Mycolicibacterium sp. XJ1819]